MRLFDTVFEGSTTSFVNDVPVFEGYTEDAAGHITACAEAQEDMTSVYEAMHTFAMIELTMEKDTTGVNESNLEIALENAVTDVFTKIKDMLKKLWGKLTNFFKSIMMSIDARIKSTKDFATKYMPKLEDAQYKATKKFEVEMYQYPNVESKVAAVAFEKVKKVIDTKVNTGLANGTKEEAAKFEANTEEIIEAMRGSVIGLGRIASEDFKKELVNYFRGEKTAKTTLNAADVKKVLDSADSKDVIKKAKADMDKQFSEEIAELDKLAKESEKHSTDMGKSELFRNVKRDAVRMARLRSKLFSNGATIATAAFNVWKDAYNGRVSAYKTYTIKAITFYGKSN